MAKTVKQKKGETYKLGQEASLFVYAPLGIKVLEGQSVVISSADKKHPDINKAIKNGHLVLADEGDVEARKGNITNADEADETGFNLAKASKADIIAELIRLNPEDHDEDELEKKNKPVLIQLYKDEVEPEDEDSDDDDSEDEDDE